MSLAYNPALDGVRAISAIAVIANHTFLDLANGGFIGVDVFFVLSGYLITKLLRDELQSTGRIDLKRFYLRRAARLMPPLLLCLAATYIAYRFLWPDIDMLAEVGTALVYMSHYSMALWDEPHHLAHTWSLSVEEHFYLIWPVLLMLTRSLADRVALKVLVLMFLAATLWRFADTLMFDSWQWTYYRMDTRLSGLILGSILAVGRWQISEKHAATSAKYALYLLAVVVIMFDWTDMMVLQVGLTVVELAAAALIISLTSGHSTPASRCLSHPALVYLGVLSYSIYLWHYGFACFFREAFNPWLAFGLTLAISVVIAMISHRFVERPARARVNRFLSRPSKTHAKSLEGTRELSNVH